MLTVPRESLQRTVMHSGASLPCICLCCSPSSSALIPALLFSSKTTAFSACLGPGGAAATARPSALSCWSPGRSRDRLWAPRPSAAPAPPAAPTTTSWASRRFLVMAGFFRAVGKTGIRKPLCLQHVVSFSLTYQTGYPPASPPRCLQWQACRRHCRVFPSLLQQETPDGSNRKGNVDVCCQTFAGKSCLPFKFGAPCR